MPPGLAAETRELLGRLLGRLAHEIRNPLSSLDIHVQLLAEDVSFTAPETRKALENRLEIIRGELSRLESIVKRFMRLASPTALELESVDIPAVINHVCRLLSPEAQNREVDLISEIEPNLPALRADGVQLTQALLNLLINALQAVDKHGRIDLRVKCIENCEILFEVQDTGPGVPLEKMAAVFQPYYSTKAEGSGLGLWIVQQIATAHAGKLLVTNAVDRGAIFRMRLPIAGPNPPK